ncbi:centromere protein F isoform X3 [Dunckerocampus dactyliophorus]|uniref:centromere protein F isoform X3 n=1 Tax=Dunckerocampus dactyliophorus TaxID=161453 RepID=UPI002404AC3A|nr:centromere protein F isoform X3 [Dunckerocampus dactyliophorus]
MSWAEDDWTVGLSGRALQKVKELQIHQERLSRESKQKQLQLDNIQISHDKQTVKYEEVRGELQAVQRELQSVREEAKLAVTTGQRLSQELQTKQAQVCSLEGQLDAARTLSNKLTQEVKRLEAELEKLYNSSRSTDTTPFSTPCWSTGSPWEHHGSRKGDRMSQREEAESRSVHIRQRLQFSEAPSTLLPQQLKTTPRSHPSDQSDSFASPLAAFPWERDDPRPVAKRPSPSSPQTPCADIIRHGQSQQKALEDEQELRAQTEKTLSQMQRQISSLEEELSGKTESLKSLQCEMEQSKTKMAATKLSLQRAHNELSAAHTRISQESERASGAEQRLKQLQEELKCQRQNAESSRLQHQQRAKELEKQHQRDLLELQKEKQGMEKQHQQEVNKLNQELQQARTLHNALQAQVDKLSLQKQGLDKELGSLKEKVKFTERQLQDSQKKEMQIQAKLKEVMRDAEGVAESLGQSKKRERVLEEEAIRLEEERADALRLLKDLQGYTQTAHVPPVGQSFSSQPFSLPTRSSAYTKGPVTPRVEQRRGKREEEIQQMTSYPHDREPGEGIDSEHIITDSECSHGERNYEEKDSNALNKAPTQEESDRLILESLKSEQSIATDDLQRENAVLRSELHDVREELQKRLEDLEAQRRAEVEARTRLKQLSHKHTSQGAERDEQDKQWKAQLEKEKAEIEMLRKALITLETDMEREKDGTKHAQEDREAVMMQLNLQLKEQLGEVKVQLALEREGREQEKEELTQIIATEREGKREQSMKLEELAAELAQLKCSRDEEKLSASKPVTCLTLHYDQLNSNFIASDNKLSSPEQHVLFCQSTNQHNTLVSQAMADLIQEEQTTMRPQHAVMSDEGQTVVSGVRDSASLTHSDLQKDESVISDLNQEIERLRKENAQEAERAEQFQIKLAALQNQLTRQTRQLTLGFEKQSQYISALLAELQEKDRALLSQGEELQCCARALDALKDEITGEDMTRRKEGKVGKMDDEGQTEDALDSLDSLELQTVSVITSRYLTDSDLQKHAVVAQLHGFVCSGKTEGIQASATEAACGQDEGQAPSIAPLLSAETYILSDATKLEQEQAQQDSGSITSHETRRTDIKGQDLEREKEQDAASPRLISHLQQQVVALQKKLQELSEMSKQQAEELAIWRLASQSSSTSKQDQIFPSPGDPSEMHPNHMTHTDNSLALVIREDEVFLSCISDRLQGRMLSTSVRQNSSTELSIHLPPAAISKGSEQETKLSGTCFSQHKVERESELLHTPPVQGGQQDVTTDSSQCSDAASGSWRSTKDLKMNSHSSATSVSTQTEESGSAAAPERHCVHTQTEDEEDEELDNSSPTVSKVETSEARGTRDKMLFSTSFPIPADPVRLVERIRRNRTQLSAAFDDTEYEPYGLPEVVMKGFADIPTGPSCPYIVRRGLLGTAVVPVTRKEVSQEDETD